MSSGRLATVSPRALRPSRFRYPLRTSWLMRSCTLEWLIPKVSLSSFTVGGYPLASIWRHISSRVSRCRGVISSVLLLPMAPTFTKNEKAHRAE